MNPLPRKQGLPDDSGMAIGIETMTVIPSESLSRSSAVRFGKNLNIAVGVPCCSRCCVRMALFDHNIGPRFRELAII